MTVGSSPEGRDWALLPDHLILKLCSSNSLVQIVKEHDLKVSAKEPDVTETEGKIDVLIVLDKILNSQEQGVQSIVHHVNSEASGGGHWHWVGVDGSETLLVDRMLRDRWGNFLLTVVSNQMVLDCWVNHKHWFQMMNILSLLSLGEDVGLWASVSSGDLWELCLDVVGEASEFLHVH